MKIVYFSLTGNIKRFVDKINYDCISGNADMLVSENFVLITYTINFGEVPKNVDIFLKNNHHKLIGVVGSGNTNWGSSYCKAADIISEKYNVKMLQKFELSGNKHDVQRFNKIIREL